MISKFKSKVKIILLSSIFVVSFTLWLLINHVHHSPAQWTRIDRQTDIFRTQTRDTPVHPFYAEFQLLNDNLTYVYVGYYDDRVDQAVVKVIAEIPRLIKHTFTVTANYPDHTTAVGDCNVKFFSSKTRKKWTVNDQFKNGFIVCPVDRDKGSPDNLWLGKKGDPHNQTLVIIKHPPQNQYNLTRCLPPLVFGFKDAPLLATSIEIGRQFGVEKTIVYLDTQSPDVMKLLLSYEQEGIVELRNFSIFETHSEFSKYQQRVRKRPQYKWNQWLAINDCLLSQIKSAKYMVVNDVDESLVPRQHTTLWQLGDHLSGLARQDNKKPAAFIFSNVFYPTYMAFTKTLFPWKRVAKALRLQQLLHTTRLKTNVHDYQVCKSMVIPSLVEVQYLHFVNEFIDPTYTEMWVNETLGTSQHFRGSKRSLMSPPETDDTFLLQFADTITKAVIDRFIKSDYSPN